MALVNKKLTEREKAALILYVYGYCEDWRELYAIAVDTPHDKALRDINIAVYASRWKNTAKVREFLAQEKERREIWLGKERERIAKEYKESAADSVRIETLPEKRQTNFIDYSDPANQRRKLNELVNTAEDSGEALDALKVIIAGQKDDKQAAREQQQQRFYVPKTCEECEIKRAFAILRKQGK